MALRKVHRRDVEAMSARLLARGLSPKTVSNTLKILHGVFEHAIDLEWTNDNPVRRAARPKHVRDSDPELRFLTVEELEAVLRAIPDEIVVREPKPFRAGRRGPRTRSAARSGGPSRAESTSRHRASAVRAARPGGCRSSRRSGSARGRRARGRRAAVAARDRGGRRGTA